MKPRGVASAWRWPRRIVAGAVLGLALVPAVASAHGGLVGRSDLPIPQWLFAWAASTVLIVSFVALAILWREPRLERYTFRPLRPGTSAVMTSRAVDVSCGAIGLLIFVLVIWSGLTGTTTVAENFAPTWIFVIFWVGLVFASVVLGDVYRLFNPVRALGRGVSWIANQMTTGSLPPPLPYPAKLGNWPAAAGLIAFTLLELVSSSADNTQSIAIAALVYVAANSVGMAIYGVEPWVTKGDGFAVYFNLFSRISIFERRNCAMGLRPLLSGLTTIKPINGSVAVLMVMIGTVSFDGASGGEFFQGLVPGLLDFWSSLSFSAQHSLELTFATGYIAAILIIAALYRLGAIGASRVGLTPKENARAFVHSLVPIAFAYSGAHYISLLVYQSQAAFSLISDPLGRGWDLFGTAGGSIDYTFVSATTFWYLQVALVIAGHVAALISAHDRALVLYGDTRAALRSQYWMLAVMVSFTTLALWLLSQQNEG